MESESTIDYNALVEDHTIISRTNLEGIITYVNQNFCDACGYTKEELIGKSHNIVRHPDVAKSFYGRLWQSIESNETWHGVFRNIDKNGHVYYANATVFPTLNSKGDRDGYMAIHYLVTEDEHIKQHLKKQLVIYKSEKARQSRELAHYDLKIKKDVEKELMQKYTEYIKNLEEQLRRLRMVHKQDIATIRSLEDELKAKKLAMDTFNTKSKTTIKTLSAERIELINSVETLKKSNDSYKVKVEKAQESVVTFQGYIDEYRKKIDDLKDVIASYESDKTKESQQESSAPNQEKTEITDENQGEQKEESSEVKKEEKR